MRKILVKENPTGVVVVGIIFAAFFLFMALFILGSMVPLAPSGFAIPFFLFPIVFIAILLVVGLRVLTGSKKASRLFNEAELSEKTLSLPVEVEYEVGRVFLEGYWSHTTMSTGSGRTSSRSYRTRRTFRLEKRGRGSTVELPKGPFRVELLPDGTGIIDAPAVRIRSEPYGNSMVMLFTDSGRVECNASLTLQHGNDVATVQANGDGKFLRGSVYGELTKARNVRIEVGSGNVWKKIAEGKNFQFSFSTLPEEKTAVFAHYDTVSPRSIMRKLWRGSVILGHGNFELKAVLDIPLGRDVVETEPFKVVFKE